jgi:TonB family protein
MMSFSWKQYEGQVINNTFPLQRYLGASSNSAVFLTQLAGPQSSKAAIKLIPEEVSADFQLSLWRRASKFTHPNLLQLYQGGRCRLADMDLLYVVMEYAEEDLSQILPQRALTPSEARDMLGPLLDALSDLHGQGLVHSRLKPSNVLATSDQVKLSTDTLFPVGESRKPPMKRSVYDAPESASQPLTGACDVWSLGVMLVEVLTQRAPDWQPGGQALPVAPESLPRPFLDIARHALERDPKLRWTMADIAGSLNPRAAAAAAQSVAPLSVPLSPIPAVPVAKLPAPKPAPLIAKAPPPPRPVMSAPKQAIVLPSYVVPLAVAMVVVGAIIALPKILGRRVETSSSASTSAVAHPVAPERAGQPASPEVSRSAKSNSPSGNRDSLKSTVGKQTAKEVSQASAVSSSPASLRTETKAAPDVPKSSETGSAHGEVLDQILPDVSGRALATIQGTVRVSLRAHVDAAGNVSAAEVDNRGPSQYFADLALKAVRRWEFTSPEVGGRSVPSEWQIRFEFSRSGVKAFPKQTAP